VWAWAYVYLNKCGCVPLIRIQFLRGNNKTRLSLLGAGLWLGLGAVTESESESETQKEPSIGPEMTISENGEPPYDAT